MVNFILKNIHFSKKKLKLFIIIIIIIQFNIFI